MLACASTAGSLRPNATKFRVAARRTPKQSLHCNRAVTVLAHLTGHVRPERQLTEGETQSSAGGGSQPPFDTASLNCAEDDEPGPRFPKFSAAWLLAMFVRF